MLLLLLQRQRQMINEAEDETVNIIVIQKKIGKTALWFDRAKNLLTENSNHIFVVNAYIYI